jgi:dTDP-4-amino-4,6-dideoxygalactose transaminase
MWKIPLFKLNFDSAEEKAAARVIEGGWLTMGEEVINFEKSFAQHIGDRNGRCTAVSSGTAALHIALLALGIRNGDEVIVPALTFVAAANVVRMVGATPVFADCSSTDHWNVSAETLAARITRRTKAINIVHYAGYPCDMDSIVALCQDHGIALIEDAAHAPGATVNGRYCGTMGDVGCFSFFSNKNLSIGEGGMVVAKADDVHQRLRYLRSHGMTTLTLDRHLGRANTYDVVMPGLNYRMDEIRAAIGIAQLVKLPNANRARARITERYRHLLAETGVQVPFSRQSIHSQSAYHIMPVLVPREVNRSAVIEGLKARGVQSSIHYPSFTSFTAYRGYCLASDIPIATDVCARELTLPLYPGMQDEDVDYVVDSLKSALW